jgi:uncharacterized protein (DUF983 family)
MPRKPLNLKGHDTGGASAVNATLVLGTFFTGPTLFLELTYVAPPMSTRGSIVPGLTLLILLSLKGLSVALQYQFRSTDEEGQPGEAKAFSFWGGQKFGF